MSSALTIFLIAALLCIAMLLMLRYFMRSGIAGIREWGYANLLACIAFILYAFGRELPPLIAYEAANVLYAAASAFMLAGFQRFFARPSRKMVLSGTVLAVGLGIAFFHYVRDSFDGRSIVVSLFQAAIALGIGMTVLRAIKVKRRSRYPYHFTMAMALVVALGHLLRVAVHMGQSGDMTSLLQPSPWNLFFVSAGTMALPALTLGGVMMVHDVMLAKAEHAANRDFLTGAWSRRAFFALAEVDLKRARRSHRDVSLLLFDVDHFKAINDSLGHAAGDRVLVDAVARAEGVIRNGDYLGRIGGEEFAVLLPETGIDAALAVAERLRAGLQVRADEGIEFTVSIGVAVLRHEESVADMMRRADAALYRAKIGGRNRVERELA
ncbi:GGDEF domain-containing protein [Janthinobacterium sp. 17J80-10]|uniref:GGDEF domain-containing protein n=1 Tax=Janthinobacterium sp. 17J80-10 TaxID=2497863 RepID=UPI0010057998|nr:GGDEF domain-containing protein [Janthinobacterium sp. 17J80-10]QAU32975.1 GGDEF domain-containing protein [Janthinobacterium sp. 17J80-10]